MRCILPVFRELNCQRIFRQLLTAVSRGVCRTCPGPVGKGHFSAFSGGAYVPLVGSGGYGARVQRGQARSIAGKCRGICVSLALAGKDIFYAYISGDLYVIELQLWVLIRQAYSYAAAGYVRAGGDVYCCLLYTSPGG